MTGGLHRGYYRISSAFDRVSGWTLGAEEIHVVYDGQVVARGTPDGVSDEVQKRVPGALEFDMGIGGIGSEALAIVSGRLRVIGTTDGESFALNLSESYLRRCLDRAHEELSRLRGAPEPAGWPPLLEGVSPADYTPMQLPIGYTKGSAIVGRGGNLFLHDGSNALQAQYEGRLPGGVSVEQKAREWALVFENRAKALADRGIKYRQLVIPEKNTVMAQDSPTPVTHATPLLSRLEHMIRDQPWYVPTLEPLIAAQSRSRTYLATDTHLSPFGAQVVMAMLFHTLDFDLGLRAESMPLDRLDAYFGDLAAHMGAPLASLERFPSQESVEMLASGLKTIERYFGQGNVGRRFVYENVEAPSRSRVLVFGNSFFSEGTHAGQLAWWAKLFFRKTSIYWTPDFDLEVVDALAPDLVIGQTIERFLPRVAEQ